MTFNDNARLDPSQVEDRRGMRTPILAGGGITIVILVASLILGVDPTGLLEAVDTVNQVTQVENGPSPSQCQTGADANTKDDCRIVGFVDSVQKYWSDELGRRGKTYQPATTVLYSGATQSACGTASTASGPFYCPEDKKVYLDLTFFQDMKAQLGVEATPFAQGYVIAHEYGHHIQDLLGTLNMSSQTGATSQSVRIELQADCYSGVWAGHAADTGVLQTPTQAEVTSAMNAAAAVGDDRIQRQTQGRVTPDAFTHGTSEQRLRWFTTGYQTGDMARCDTSGAL